MSSLVARDNAIIPHTGVDFSTATGLLLKENAGALAVNDSATVPARAVCLEGNAATKQSTIAVLGAVRGTVLLKAGANVTKFNLLQQKNDGTVIPDAGSGARVIVGVALETATSGALFEAALIGPLYYSV